MSNSAEVAPLLSTRESHWPSNLRRWQEVALLLLIGWLYASILAHLVLQWIRDQNFQHGIFVPLFSLFVLWQDRKKLKVIPSAPSWTGLPVEVLSMIVLVLGILGAEIFSARVSLLILLAGLIVLFRGWTFFRAVLFPWAFLFLMIPPPNLILSKVTFPLQLLASRLATELLRLVFPVFQQGNVIHLPKMDLNVVEACSGIRSLLTLVTLAIIYGYLMETRTWVRVLLVCLAVPIAVAANSFRVFGTGLLVQYWDADKALGFFHKFEGWLIFVVALILLFAVHRVISLIWKSNPVAAHVVAPPQEPSAAELRAQGGFLRFGIAAGLMLVTAFGLLLHPHSEVFPPREGLRSLPYQLDGWTGTDDVLDEPTLEILGYPEYLLRDYENANQPQPPINLFIPYYTSQRAGDTIHSPQHCLPGSGWVPTSREVVRIRRPDGTSFLANRYVGSESGERPELVLYWFQAHGRAVASEYSAKYYLIADSIRMNRSDGALVRLMTPMLDGESADAAQARVMKLGSQLLPLLDNYIPR